MRERGGPREGLCRTSVSTEATTGASFLRTEPLLSSDDLYNDYGHRVESRDGTEGAHGHPEAEEGSKGRGSRGRFRQLPLAQPASRSALPSRAYL